MDPKAPPSATTSSGDTASKHIKIAMAKLLTLCFAAASAFQVPTKLELPKLHQVAPVLAAAAVNVHAEMAHAKVTSLFLKCLNGGDARFLPNASRADA